jgi:RimJ/RimL family protein N-acetyltransferase
MPLQTPRLDLEPVQPDHAREVWAQLDDDRMWRYFPALRPATIEELRALYEKWARGSPHADQVWLNWLCRNRASGALVGSVQATVFPREGSSYIAYAIYPAHQRKGYAREAAQAVIAYVKGAYGVHRFFAEMDMRNEPSYRLAESLGFVRVETRVDAVEYLYELAL